MLWARITGVAAEIPFVSVTPGMLKVAPPSAVRCSVEVKNRGPVEAATVVTHGPPWSVVAAAGPLLPADAFTEMPAWYASRKASSTGSVYGSPPPEIEKLRTLTPSAIACCTAATESELKQPCAAQTRYIDRRARPARSRTPAHARRRRARPTGRSRLPPWSSCACRDPRGHAASTHAVVLLQNSFEPAPTFAMYVAMNA